MLAVLASAIVTDQGWGEVHSKVLNWWIRCCMSLSIDQYLTESYSLSNSLYLISLLRFVSIVRANYKMK